MTLPVELSFLFHLAVAPAGATSAPRLARSLQALPPSQVAVGLTGLMDRLEARAELPDTAAPPALPPELHLRLAALPAPEPAAAAQDALLREALAAALVEEPARELLRRLLLAPAADAGGAGRRAAERLAYWAEDLRLDPAARRGLEDYSRGLSEARRLFLEGDAGALARFFDRSAAARTEGAAPVGREAPDERPGSERRVALSGRGLPALGIPSRPEVNAARDALERLGLRAGQAAASIGPASPEGGAPGLLAWEEAALALGLRLSIHEPIAAAQTRWARLARARGDDALAVAGGPRARFQDAGTPEGSLGLIVALSVFSDPSLGEAETVALAGAVARALAPGSGLVLGWYNDRWTHEPDPDGNAAERARSRRALELVSRALAPRGLALRRVLAGEEPLVANRSHAWEIWAVERGG